MKKDEKIQRRLDNGEEVSTTDLDAMTYQALYKVLHQASPFRLSNDFAERVTAQINVATTPTPQSVGVTVACVLITLFTCGLALYFVDTLVLMKIASWITHYKELVGFCVVMFTLIQTTDYWLLRNTR